jgi:hypothetical protein
MEELETPIIAEPALPATDLALPGVEELHIEADIIGTPQETTAAEAGVKGGGSSRHKATSPIVGSAQSRQPEKLREDPFDGGHALDRLRPDLSEKCSVEVDSERGRSVVAAAAIRAGAVVRTITLFLLAAQPRYSPDLVVRSLSAWRSLFELAMRSSTLNAES